jgi:hypothetical protein
LIVAGAPLIWSPGETLGDETVLAAFKLLKPPYAPHEFGSLMVAAVVMNVEYETALEGHCMTERAVPLDEAVAVPSQAAPSITLAPL